MEINEIDAAAIPLDVAPHIEIAAPTDLNLDDESAPAPTERPKSRRELAMDAIVDANAKAQAGDLPGRPGDGQLAAQLAADERPTAFAASQLVPVKVDGVAGQVSIEELTRNYQKTATADRRLQEATELLRLAKEQANAPAVEPLAVEPPPTDDARRKRITDALDSFVIDGEQEGLVNLLDSAFSAGATATQPPAVDMNAIAAQLETRIAVKGAYAQAQQDYPALFADDPRGAILGQATLTRMESLVALGVPREQAVKDATAEVATLFGLPQPGRSSTPARTTERDDKLARKAALDNPSTAHAAAAALSSPSEQTNPSAVIAAMARARPGSGRQSG